MLWDAQEKAYCVLRTPKSNDSSDPCPEAVHRPCCSVVLCWVRCVMDLRTCRGLGSACCAACRRAAGLMPSGCARTVWSCLWVKERV